MLAHSEHRQRPLRLVVVDDHDLTRHAVSSLLQRESPLLDVVATTGHAGAVLGLVRGAKADMVLLDLDLGNASGYELIPELRLIGVAVVVFTASDDPQDRVRAFRAGADAYVCKLAPAAEMVSAVLRIGSRCVCGRDNCHAAGGSPELEKRGEISTATIDFGFIK